MDKLDSINKKIEAYMEEHYPPAPKPNKPTLDTIDVDEFFGTHNVKKIIKMVIRKVLIDGLNVCGGNVRRTSVYIGYSAKESLRRYIKEFDIDVADIRKRAKERNKKLKQIKKEYGFN